MLVFVVLTFGWRTGQRNTLMLEFKTVHCLTKKEASQGERGQVGSITEWPLCGGMSSDWTTPLGVPVGSGAQDSQHKDSRAPPYTAAPEGSWGAAEVCAPTWANIQGPVMQERRSRDLGVGGGGEQSHRHSAVGEEPDSAAHRASALPQAPQPLPGLWSAAVGPPLSLSPHQPPGSFSGFSTFAPP